MLAKVQMPEPKFQISTLEHEDVHVFLTTMDGGEHVGRMFLTAAGKQRFERWEGGKRYSKLPYQFVSLWRPIDVRKWPFGLPAETATLSREIRRPVPEPRLSEEFVAEGEGWPYPGLHLGRPGEPPECVEEVEARLLRAIRTRKLIEREVQRVQLLWPKPWEEASRLVLKQLVAQKDRGVERPVMANFRAEDQDDFHVEKSGLNPRPARFAPKPRDVSDYEANTDKQWLALMWKRDRSIFHCRAELPPIQWWAIADQERVDEGKIKQRYRDALEMVFRKVRAG